MDDRAAIRRVVVQEVADALNKRDETAFWNAFADKAPNVRALCTRHLTNWAVCRTRVLTEPDLRELLQRAIPESTIDAEVAAAMKVYDGLCKHDAAKPRAALPTPRWIAAWEGMDGFRPMFCRFYPNFHAPCKRLEDMLLDCKTGKEKACMTLADVRHNLRYAEVEEAKVEPIVEKFVLKVGKHVLDSLEKK